MTAPDDPARDYLLALASYFWPDADDPQERRMLRFDATLERRAIERSWTSPGSAAYAPLMDGHATGAPMRVVGYPDNVKRRLAWMESHEGGEIVKDGRDFVARLGGAEMARHFDLGRLMDRLDKLG